VFFLAWFLGVLLFAEQGLPCPIFLLLILAQKHRRANRSWLRRLHASKGWPRESFPLAQLGPSCQESLHATFGTILQAEGRSVRAEARDK
jgi:hypothetical protein